ncbi:MAG: OstA-like protein [Bacteroidota bacterium]
MKLLQYSILFCLLIGVASHLEAQQKKKIQYKADSLINKREKGETYRILWDNVVFQQQNTTIYCDSSVLYPARNAMEAFGRVRIVDDSVTITSRKLIYEGNERKARLRENVIYTRGERQLFTDFLDYDLETEVAHYYNDGKLVDTTNTLTSNIGYFYAQENYALFWKDVVLTAPEYVLEADTLKYNTITKVAYTYGPTEITSNDGTILYSQASEFQTVADQSEFEKGNIETLDYTLEGDHLFFDDLRKYYKAIGNVKLVAKEKDIIIIGEEGYYDKQKGISKVFGNPIMKRILQVDTTFISPDTFLISADTFYVAADTMVSIESEYDSLKRVLAYHDVKIFKEGLSGIADSISYFLADSIIFFYQDPVMWNEKNQIEADTIYLEVSENEIKKMHMLANSFMSQEDTISNFNQIKGRNMIANFKYNQINTIDVDGNGELLYYALEDGDSTVMGLNKLFTSRMRMRFRDKALINFSAYNNPDAQFIPPHELTAEIQRLEGFSWRIEERPALVDVAPYFKPTEKVITIDSVKPQLPLEKDENIPIKREPRKIPDNKRESPTSQILLKKE